MRALARSLLNLAGKDKGKVAAVFGFTPQACHQTVVYLRAGAPHIPIWLFSTALPTQETAALCGHVLVRRSSIVLLILAELRLWPHWVAISAGAWTGEHGKWAVKLAPLLVPPCRALLLNEHGDYFKGTPAAIFHHCRQRLRDRVHARWCGLREAIHRSRCGLRKSIRRSWFGLREAIDNLWDAVRRAAHVLSAVALLAFAMVLRRCGYPHRQWFRRLHGSNAYPLFSFDTAPDMCEGVLRVSGGEHWKGQEFERLARSSNARWILWQSGPLPEALVDRLMTLFEGRLTFAVSRQTFFRAWKPGLLPMSPFRQLQPDEATQVLAPISSHILVDRRKLLELGVPRCSYSRTAWMLLFWKAAAAGLRSYSVGQSAALVEEPDLPVQEASFFLNFLRQPELRQLGPREPDLSRGAVAFAPWIRAGPLGDRKRPRVLVVSPFLPYPLSHGGAVRIYNLCRALSGDVDFVLAAMREARDITDYERLRAVFREVHVIDKAEPASADSSLPAQVRQHQSRALRASIAELARKWEPDLLQIEYTHLASFRDAAPELPAILVEHDLTFALYRQLAKKNPADRQAHTEYERWLAFESRWLGEYDGVWTVSEADRDSVLSACGRAPELTFVIPNGVDLQRFAPSETREEQEILFVGSFRHLPNLLGFEMLRKEIMPRIWGVCPNARLRVVAGPQHQEFQRRFAQAGGLVSVDRRAEIHGFVEDLRPLYERAAVVVVPLEVSAGTNIKVMEAMACGKAVVSTPVGCAGLGLEDGREIAIAADFQRFAQSVCELLGDNARRRRMGIAARRAVEPHFSWTAIAQTALESYQALARARFSPAGNLEVLPFRQPQRDAAAAQDRAATQPAIG